MAISTDSLITVLNDLIQTCKDSEKGFREAAEEVKSPQLRSMFLNYASERGRYATQLQDEVSRLGRAPETSGSVSASLHRRWIDLKSALTGKDDHAIVEECERGEDMAVEAYRDALAKDLPSDLQSVVKRQYEGVQAVHNKMRDMKQGALPA